MRTPSTAIVVDMPATDPLQPLLELGGIADLAREASAAVAAVHRRPVSLRRADVTGSESVLRGARTSALIDDPRTRRLDTPAGPLGAAISVYGLLAPGTVEHSARTFLRAPLQILARMDTLAGGDGLPVAADGAARLQALAGLITGGHAHDVLLPQVVHGEIAGHRIFGERSGLIARAAARLTAVTTGFDPRGLAVPETHLNRHRAHYLESLAEGYGEDFLELSLRAWIAGADEAEAIARAV